MSKRILASESGIGLISTMVAIVLLGVAVTALSSSGMMVLAVHTDSAVRSTATAIAASYLEEVKARQPGTLASESATSVSSDGVKAQSGIFVRSLEVVPEENLAYTKRVTVNVEFPSGRGRTGTVQLVTVVYEGDDRK